MIWMIFISFSCLNFLARISSVTQLLCWIRVVGVGILVLFILLEGKLSPFHYWICYLWACQVWPLLCWVFNHELILYFAKEFSASIEMVIWFFIPYSFNVIYHIEWFSYVEFPLQPRNTFLLIRVCDPFNILLNQFADTFVEYFCICTHQGYWPTVFFFL